jgi:hypothetical protein
VFRVSSVDGHHLPLIDQIHARIAVWMMIGPAREAVKGFYKPSVGYPIPLPEPLEPATIVAVATFLYLAVAALTALLPVPEYLLHCASSPLVVSC